jgi:hypothetical protein
VFVLDDNVRDQPFPQAAGTPGLRAALHQRLLLEGYQCPDEVRYRDSRRAATRSIDVLGVHVEAYRGPATWDLLACELKWSGQDFLQDVRKPEKQEPWRETAHRHAFVVPRGLVRPSEVPDGSGLAELGLRQFRREGFQQVTLTWTLAPQRRAAVVPDWLLADLMYRSSVKSVGTNLEAFVPSQMSSDELDAWRQDRPGEMPPSARSTFD